MTWNYRITREILPDGEHYFAIREVYYDDEGKVTSWTEAPVAARGDSAMECAEAVTMMAGCIGQGVLDLKTRETLTLHGKCMECRTAGGHKSWCSRAARPREDEPG